jgi:hypothetical protein
MHFIVSLVHGTEALVFIQQWGWLVGILWLAGVVLWAANRPPDEAVRQARRMEELRQGAMDVIRKFEALSSAYEESLNQASGPQAEARRYQLALAAGRLLKSAIETIPENQQWLYKRILMQVLLDYHQYYDQAPTHFAGSVHPTLAIQIALGMNSPPKKKEPSDEEGTSG